MFPGGWLYYNRLFYLWDYNVKKLEPKSFIAVLEARKSVEVWRTKYTVKHSINSWLQEFQGSFIFINADLFFMVGNILNLCYLFHKFFKLLLENQNMQTKVAYLSWSVLTSIQYVIIKYTVTETEYIFFHSIILCSYNLSLIIIIPVLVSVKTTDVTCSFQIY